jgi:hypothetical protein
MHVTFWYEDLKGTNDMGKPTADDRIILKWDAVIRSETGTGFKWLMTEYSGGLTRTFGLDKN